MPSARPLSLVAAVLLACHPQPASDQALIDANGDTFSVRVINRNMIDVQVFIAHDSRRDRLGLAIASTTTEFAIPLRALGAGREYRLVGEPVGMRIRIMTETLHAQTGDEVTWQLEDSFARSSVVVH